MQELAKIYMHNTNMLYTVAPDNNSNSTIRQTFYIRSAINKINCEEGFNFKVNDDIFLTLGQTFRAVRRNGLCSSRQD